jgi:arsenate reductase (glutaredoxin)
MIKIFHNPRCRKSREGLAFLKSKTSGFTLVDYLKTGLCCKDLEEILLKSNLDPVDLVRQQEDIFISNLKGKTFTREEWVEIICENPKLLQRPIVVGRYKAVIAVPPEKAEEVMRINKI